MNSAPHFKKTGRVLRFWFLSCSWFVLKSHYLNWLVTRHMSANHHGYTMDRKKSSSWPLRVKSKGLGVSKELYGFMITTATTKAAKYQMLGFSLWWIFLKINKARHMLWLSKERNLLFQLCYLSFTMGSLTMLSF